MTPSQNCVDLIQHSEGCSLSAYQDSAGVWTIGWGHTGPEVSEGITWSQERCDAQLMADIQSHTDCVDTLVKVPLTQGQFDALTDFAYNMGCEALGTSTLLRLLNLGNYAEACQQLFWIDDANELHGWIHAGGRALPGLVTRRKAEQELWNS